VGPRRTGEDTVTFEFPPQDYKLRAGDEIRDPQQQWVAGKVVEVNDNHNWITVKLSGNAVSHHPEAIFPFAQFRTEAIDLALVDLADDLLSGGAPRFAAAAKLLLRETPYFGEEIHADSAQQRRDLLSEMEGSYLVAQGPPGTGKTFTAADLIVDHMIRGKRVGVTAGTHTAINNLLHAVEQAAVERGHVFSGVKKDPKRGDYASPNGWIESVTTNPKAIDAHADLTAGTRWLFSRPEWHNELDLLVIDEAGQFALSSALAVGTSAKTLLMVGDPNQLPQVTQGAHPPGAGASALEHVLGDHRTIPATLGIFLPESRRMAPELCSFVSDAFYEGRLRTHECAEDYGPAGSSAIKFVAVEHENNRQDSIEEVMAIVDLIRDGRDAVDTSEVMVVSPYNAQVDLLRAEIDALVPGGEKVKVFTVDKCQGQEAEVVYFSLASSGGDDVPRGFEFLFSANRFNVAISRARRAAYLVCSPALLQVNATSVEQMRLADAFLAYVERAELESIAAR
ncbi:MAG: DEAD/DEAH box helicase, partial [Solirubrobacterales bacterium]